MYNQTKQFLVFEKCLSPGEEIYFYAPTNDEKEKWVRQIFLLTKQTHETDDRSRSSSCELNFILRPNLVILCDDVMDVDDVTGIDDMIRINNFKIPDSIFPSNTARGE